MTLHYVNDSLTTLQCTSWRNTNRCLLWIMGEQSNTLCGQTQFFSVKHGGK